MGFLEKYEERKKTKTKSFDTNQNKTSQGFLEKYEARNETKKLQSSINLDTFESDLTSMSKTLMDIQSGWQTPETMKNTLSSVQSMYDRIGKYQEYQKKYGGADLSEIHTAYKDVLDKWGDLSTAYGGFKNAEAFDKAKKEYQLSEKFKGLTYDQVQEERKKYKPDSDEYRFLHGYSQYTDLADFDKAMKHATPDVYAKLETARNKHELDFSFDAYKGLMQNEDFAEKSKYVSTKGDFDGFWDKMFNDQYSMGYGDLTYEYINNVDGMRDEITRKAIIYKSDSSRDTTPIMEKKGYHKLNPEEIATYNYLYRTDKESAQKFLDDMEITLSKRVYDEKTQMWKDNAEGIVGGTLSSIVSIPASVFGSIPTFMDTLSDAVQGKEYNPYSYFKTATNYAQDSREYVGENIAEATEGWDIAGMNIPSFLYSTGMSIADNLVGASTLQQAYLPLMGTNAFHQKAKEMTEAGEDSATIYKTALASGAAEMIFEKFSLDHFLKIKDVDSIGKIIYNTLTQAGIEGSEELATELSNIITDSVIRGKDSDLVKMHEDLLKRGFTEKEADIEVAKHIGSQVTWATIGGAISGGAMGSVGATANYMDNSATGRLLKDNEQAQAIFDIANTSEMESAYEAYNQYIGKGATAENISKAKLGNLYNKAKGDVAKTLKSDMASDGQKSTALANALKLGAVDKAVATGIKKKEDRKALENSAKKDFNVDKNAEESVITESGKAITYKDIKVADGKISVATEDGDTSIDNATLTMEDSLFVEMASQISSEHGENLANTFLHNYDGETSLDEYATRFNLTMAYAKNNFSYKHMFDNKGSLSAEMVSDIYQEVRTKADQEQVQKIAELNQKMADMKFYKGVINDSVIDYENTSAEGKVNWNELTEQQRMSITFVKGFAQATGMNLILTHNPKSSKGGAYKVKHNTIVLDVAQWTDADTKMLKETIIPTMSHETTHWMKNKSPELWARLNEVVFSTLVDHYNNNTEAKIDFLNRKYGAKFSEADVKDMQITEEDLVKYESKSTKKSEEIAREEIIARACEDMLSMSKQGRKIFDSLSIKEQNTLVGKIKEIIKNLMDWVDELLGVYKSESKEAQILREYKDALSEAVGIWDEMLEQSIVANQSLEKSGTYGHAVETIGSRDLSEFSEAVDENGEELFQYRAVVEDEDAYREMLQKHKDAIGITDEQITDLFGIIDEAVDIISENLEALDYAWDEDIDNRAFHPVKANSDSLYEVSLDFSTLCRKRLLQQNIQTILQEALNKPLSTEESIAIRDELMKIQEEGKKIEIACALCYVESARMKSPKQIEKFLKNREKAIREFFAGRSGGDIKEKIKNAETKARKSLAKKYPDGMPGKNDATLNPLESPLKQMLKADADFVRAEKKKAKLSYVLTEHEQGELDAALKMDISNFTSAKGLENLAKEHSDIFDAYTSFIRNATRSKGLENDVWWRAGDSEAIGDALIAKMNAENGLRSQSWSDFQVIHLLDYIAATIELSTKGAKRQSYTKVSDYVKLLGNTGDMINMSLIPERAFKGKLGYDDVEGMAYKVACELRERYHATAGTICIGISNEQIRMLLDDATIDMVIPYHKSSMSKARRKLMHIPDWKDFEAYQNEDKKLSETEARARAKEYGVKLKKDENYQKPPKFSEWFNLDEARQIAKMENANPSDEKAYKKYGVMYGGYMAMQNAANKYLKLCAERGLLPKFAHPDADFSKDANYWKLLIDRKMVDNVTGEIIEQKAIKPIFNKSSVLEILNDELARYPQVKADQEYATRKVAKKFLSGKMKVDNSTLEAIKKPIDNVTVLNILESSRGEELNSERDTEGNVLSEGQIEFFKDSVIRDESGNLLVVYHGTPNKNVNAFSYDYVGTVGGSNHGYGFYFADIESDANLFAQGIGEVKKVYINITNPIYSESRDFVNKLDELFDRLPMYAKNALITKYGDLDNAKHHFYEYISKHGNGTFLAIFPEEADIHPEMFNRMILGNMGYDGIIYDEDGYNKEYIVFESNQAKLTTNTNPTEDEDIRYSERVSNRELASADNTALYIKNTKKANYIKMIFNGAKTEETRSRRTLDAFIGKDFYVTDGEYVYGSIVMGEPHKYTEKEFRMRKNLMKHRVPEGDDYDIKPGGIKWAYPILSYKKFSRPEKLSESKEYKSSFQAREVLYSERLADVKSKYKDKTDYLFISEKKDTISIDNMVVKKEYRNKGIGTQILTDIIDYADRVGKTITLTPTTEFGTKERLKKWYKKHGFVENKGRHTDFTIRDTMYRLPVVRETEANSLDDIRYSERITDKTTLDFLNEQISRGEYNAETNPNGGYYVTYKSMSFWGYDDEGNAILRSPMAEYVDGNLSNAYLIPKSKNKLNWYQATETLDETTGMPTGLLVKIQVPQKNNPNKMTDVYLPASENQHLIRDDWSNLFFLLKRRTVKNGKLIWTEVKARYNPYEHSSDSMLNDQFKGAYLRDNLVTVKMYVPVSEDGGAFRAKWSKDATGWTDWKSGDVATKIAKQKELKRRVYLSRYAAPVEIVPDSEVAKVYKEYLDGTDVKIPDNVVSPNLLKELKKIGVPIEQSGKVDAVLFSTRNTGEGLTERMYELMGETDRIRKENERFKAEIERLKERLAIEKKVTGGTQFNENQLGAVAGHLRKIASSNIDKLELMKLLKGVYTHIVTAENLAWEDVYERCYRVAEAIVKEAKPIKVYDPYTEELLKEIRSTRISFDETQKKEAAYLFDKNWNRTFFGKIIIADDAINIESKWQEWASLYPDIFTPDVGNNHVSELYSVIESLRESVETVDKYAVEEQTRWLAEQVLADDIYYGRKLGEQKTKYEKELADKKARIEKQKELYKKLRDRKNEEIALAKAHGREKLTSYKENAERKSTIQQVVATLSALNKKLLKNDKDVHIPEALKPVVISLINAVDFSSKQMLGMKGSKAEAQGTPTRKDIEFENMFGKTKAMADSNVTLKQAIQEALELFENAEKVANNTSDGTWDLSIVSLDVDLIGRIKEMIKSLDVIEKNYGERFALQQMSLEHLKTLNAMAKSISVWANNVDYSLAMKHKARISESGMNTCEENDVLGKRKQYIEAIESVKSFFSWSNLTPVNAFKRLGETAMKYFDSLRDAQDKLAFNQEEIIRFTQELFKGKEKEILKWREDVKEFTLTLPTGETKTVRMPISYVMTLYCVSKQEDAKRHLYGMDEEGRRYENNGGGMTIKAFKEKKSLEVSEDIENTIMTESLIKQITSTLTDDQIKIADELQRFMNDTGSKWGDEVSVLLYGIKKFNIENYFPITVSPNTIKVLNPQDKRQSIHFFSILNFGFTKTRNPNAQQSIEIGDIFEVFANHMSMVAIYNAYALPIYDMVRWFNYKGKNADGKEIAVTTSIEKAFGKDATRYVGRLISDLNGQHESSRLGFVTKIFRNTKLAMVGNSISVALLQPTAYLKAMTKIPTKYLLKSALYVKDFGVRHGREKAKEWCGIALWKSRNNFDTDISRNVTSEMLPQNDTVEKLKEWSLWGAGKLDELTWGVLWNACEFEVRATRKDLKVGDDEFFETVASKLRDVIYETQVVDSPLTRSDIMRSPDNLAKMLTMFGSEMTVAYNMVHEAFVDAKLYTKRNGKQGAWKRNTKSIGMALLAYTLTSAASALFSTISQAIRDDEKDEKEMEDYIKMYFSNFFSDWLIFGKIPYVKEALNYAQGYSASRPDSVWIESTIKAIKYFAKAFDGKEGAGDKAIKESLKAMSYISGLPMYNFYRDTISTLDSFKILEVEDIKELIDDIFN